MVKSKIINSFFTNDLIKLTEKYTNLDPDTIIKIENLFLNLSNQDLKVDLYSDFNRVMEIVKHFGESINEPIISIYMYINKNNKAIDINKAEEIYEIVNTKGFYNNDDFIIYSKLENIQEYVKDNIYDILSNSYEMDRIFDKDTIIDYLIDGKDLNDIGKELIENESEYTDILDINPELIYSNNNITYYYATLNI